ncbi:hypothetical protein ALQ33_200166 [Pseudomonas syringae pv. philadelphi]|uniref:Uncharacterized protein n=1 Tax=Pseudomonas syringae pv. philadelphi TaxID=251706 RepID=A0A3M3Y9V5_9PSED|nr:hypothetical protein ALQ33_200166 [Pseudomonas syringae pv. philadelphi]
MPGWQDHPNGADGILAITYLADPAQLEPRWRAIYGDAVSFDGTVLQANTRCGVLRAIDVTTAAREFPDIELPRRALEDLMRLRSSCTPLVFLRCVRFSNVTKSRTARHRGGSSLNRTQQVT